MQSFIGPEIPREIWPDIIQGNRYTSDDIRATIEVLNDDPVMPTFKIIGGRGIILAAKIRSHNFGEQLDSTGTRIEVLKHRSGWLGYEVMAMLEAMDDESAAS